MTTYTVTTDLKQMKEANLRLIEIFNSGDLERMEQMVDELYAPDAVLHSPPQPDLPPGVAGVKQFMRRMLNAYTNVHLTLNSMFGEGNELALRYTWQATNAATGEKETMILLNIGRWEGGKIVEEWELGKAPTV